MLFICGASGNRAARKFGNSELLHPILIHTAPTLSVTIIRILAFRYSSPFCFSNRVQYLALITRIEKLLHRCSRYPFR